jgi:curved DNA-binding protein CbpA
MNYYETLEISPNASQDVLKAAYKSLMQRYHPDKNPGNFEAAAHSVLVAQAYEVLSDSGKRAAYDLELKRQMESVNNMRDRTRNVRASVPLQTTERKPRRFLWLLISLLALATYFVWLTSGNKQPSRVEIREADSLPGTEQQDVQQGKTSENLPVLRERTIPVFLKDISVGLEGVDKSAAPLLDDAKPVLIIQTIGIVVGAFDSAKFSSFAEDNKAYISQKLSARLASARYDLLLKNNGEHYLKQLILDAIG